MFNFQKVFSNIRQSRQASGFNKVLKPTSDAKIEVSVDTKMNVLQKRLKEKTFSNLVQVHFTVDVHATCTSIIPLPIKII